MTGATDPAVFSDLKITATVKSVSVAGKPVVTFALSDPEGKPIIGFGQPSKSATALNNSYANLAFSLAKLVPGISTNTPPVNVQTPSKWVSYIVTTVPNTAGAVVGLTRPSTDNNGTLVDHGDGSYTYTFYRDVVATKSTVDGITVSAPNNKADLGDLTFDPNLTHRLTIQISGNAPGTGTNTPNAVQVVAGVPLKAPVDVVYDFVPATGAAPAASAKRNITTAASCDSCHSTLGGIPGDSAESSGAGFHGGARNNVEYCVVCHTDQRKYGQTEIANCGTQAAGAACFDQATLTWVAGTSTTTGAISTRVVDGRAVGDMPNMVHKTHLGGILVKSGYNYAGVEFDKGGYSQDIRNCQKCHDSAITSTPQGDNWKNVASRLACGACHDGINFATGAGVKLRDANANPPNLAPNANAHPVGAQLDDTLCATCHGPVGGTGPTRIDLYHLPVTPPNLASALHVAGGSANTHAGWIASNQSRLPAGAIKVEYEINTVSRNATNNPVMTFRLKQNGTVTPLQDIATAAVNSVTGQKEIWANFMGAPSVYFVFAVPQDGITAPVDFNASVSVYLRCLWNGTAGTTGCGFNTTTGAPSTAAGTLTGPDANGWYTATITGATVPANAVMFTGGLGYSYNNKSTLPLTQTNLPEYPATPSTIPVGSATVFPWTVTTDLFPGMPNATGGLIVIAKNVQKVATGFTGRRAIVSDDKCNACHQELGTFTEDAFHAGQRNDGTTCSWCHTPNRASSGWTAQTDNMTHAIHASAKRNVPYTWHSVSVAGDSFAHINYPGILARCTQCHLTGTYDFSATASANAVGLGADQTDKRQYRAVAYGTLSASDISLSPYVTGGVNYGTNFSFSTSTGVTTPAAGTTLVTSPTVTACVACHDSNLAVSHMVVNGGSFYEARSTAILKTEQCFVCHGPGRVAGISESHAR